MHEPLRGAAARAGLAALCAFAIGAAVSPPRAAAFDFDAGDSQLSLDTTLSHGLAFRVEDLDEGIIGPNSDDGDRNYGKGVISNTSRFISELDIEVGAVGAFARVQGFVDFENREDRDRTPLPADARDRVADDVEVLDLYLSAGFDPGGIPVDARIGNQVLNWGESTFIQGGINVINPFDVAKLRKPGAELREGLLPVPMLSLAVAPTDEFSVEGFYQLGWRETRVDPSGTYFSTNDYATPGGSIAYLANEDTTPIVSDLGGPNPMTESGRGLAALVPAINYALGCRETISAACLGERDRRFLGVSRDADREPRDSRQWGIAARLYSEALNDTEFGFYFINHHSRLPLVSARYGTLDGVTNAGRAASAAVTAVQTAALDQVTEGVTALVTAATPQITAGVTQEVRAAVTSQVEMMVPAGTPATTVEQLVMAQLATAPVRQRIADGVEDQIEQRIRNGVAGEMTRRAGAIRESAVSASTAFATDQYGRTARYFVEYPEELKVFGLSFNTVLGASGWALQGEYSYHPDTPLQRTETSIFEQGLAPLGAFLAAASEPTPENQARAAALAGTLGGYLKGYVERDVSQAQASLTKTFGPVAGADGSVFVTEAALTRIHDMPDEATMPLDTHGSGDLVADATSWGYRVAGRLDYNNAVGAARLSPYAQFQHDAGGNSAGPSGPFLEGRTALTLGVGIGYLDAVRADLSYTLFGGDTNYLSDRDFVSLSASWSF